VEAMNWRRGIFWRSRFLLDHQHRRAKALEMRTLEMKTAN